MTSPGPDADDELQQGAAELWARARVRALAAVTLIEEAVVALGEDGLDPSDRRDAERAAHRLAGSAGTFGFPRASQAARELERILGGTGRVPAEQLASATQEVAALRAALEGQPAPTALEELTGTPEELHAKPSLLMAVGDGAYADQLANAARLRGFHVVAADMAGQPPTDQDWVAAVVDLDLPEDGGLGLITRLSSASPPVPTVALTTRATFEDRLEAARHGARGLLSSAAPPEEVLDAVAGLLTRARRVDTTVLVVDDDRLVLDAVAAVLGSGGLRTVGLEDPREFWSTLEDLQPDLVILDLDMPEISGEELCRVVRNDPHWAGLPILFLTAHNSAEAVQGLFAAGADDFVAKPFAGPELLARVGNRLERDRLLRAFAEEDPLTGLTNRRRAEADLRLLLGLALRHGQPFSIAMVDLDHFKVVNDTHGHATGDTVLRGVGACLREAFRREDVVARWGGEEFLLGMYDMAPDQAQRHVGAILKTLRQERFATPSGPAVTVTFSAGIATYPHDGQSVEALCDAADRALYRAKREGRDRVVLARRSPADDPSSN